MDIGVEEEGVRTFWWEAGRNGPNSFGGGNFESSDLRIKQGCIYENSAWYTSKMCG